MRALTMLWNGGVEYGIADNHLAEGLEGLGFALTLCKSRLTNEDGTTPGVRYSDGDVAACLYNEWEDVVRRWTTFKTPDLVIRYKNKRFFVDQWRQP